MSGYAGTGCQTSFYYVGKYEPQTYMKILPCSGKYSYISSLHP